MSLDRSRFAVGVAGFSAFVDLYATQAVLPELAEAFHASIVEVGMTVTAATLAVALSGPFTGGLADMVGRKRVIVAATLLLTLPTLLIAYVGSLQELLVLRFMEGLCLPAIFAVTIAYVAEEWSEADSGDVMGWYIAGSILGGFSGRFITAVVGEHFGWRAGFEALALLNLLCALSLWRWMPASQRFQRSGAIGQTLRMMGRHLHNGRLMSTCAVGFIVLFTLVAAFTYADFYMAAPPFSLSGTALGSIFAVYLLGAAVSPLTGKLVRRIGRRAALTASMALSALGLGLTLVPSLPVVILGLALCSSGVFVTQGVAIAYIGVVTREARSAAVGLYVTCYYLGGSAGAVLPSLVWSEAGWTGCVTLIVVVQMIGVAIAVASWKPLPTPLTEDIATNS